MVESFKMTARELKRILRATVILPKEYNNTTKDYPLIYMLDGQLLEGDINLNSVSDNNKECIIIGLSSPSNLDWRVSELVPFLDINKYPNADINLYNSLPLYIINVLHPLIKQRYRVLGLPFLLGFNEGAICALYSVTHFDFFKGAGIFAPNFSICKKEIFDDLILYNTNKKSLYFFYGNVKNDIEADLFLKCFDILDKSKVNNLKLEYKQDLENNYTGFNEELNYFLEFCIKDLD